LQVTEVAEVTGYRGGRSYRSERGLEAVEKKTRIEKFEDIVAWQMGRDIANNVYDLTKTNSIRRDRSFVDQMRRAAVSVMNNIAEGYERGSNKDFVKFLFIARGSVGETRSMMYMALDQGYIDDTTFCDVSEKCRKCARMIWGLIKSLRQKADWVEDAG